MVPGFGEKHNRGEPPKNIGRSSDGSGLPSAYAIHAVIAAEKIQ
jgi:hypothetical protein